MPKKETILELDPVSDVRWGHNITLTGRLLTKAEKKGISDKKIEYLRTNGSVPEPVITGNGGHFSATMVNNGIPGKPGIKSPYDLTLWFRGDDEYLSCWSNEIHYNTLVHRTSLTLTASKPIVRAGEMFELTATLTDIDGVEMKALPNKTLKFDGTGIVPKNDGAGNSVTTAVTDDNGKAMFKALAPLETKKGWYCHAHYEAIENTHNHPGTGDSSTFGKDSGYYLNADSPRCVFDTSQPLPTVETLLIQDVELRTVGDLFAKFSLPNKATVKNIGSVKELLMTLQKFRSIDHLVLLIHGTPGTLILGGESKEISEIAKEFEGEQLPRITGKIDFEGCSVGEKPSSVLPFMKLFGCREVTAWNQFHIFSELRVVIPPNANVETVVKALKESEGYLVDGSPTAMDLAGQPARRTHVFLREWFRDDLTEEPLPSVNGLTEMERRKIFKRRRDATTRNVRSVEEIAALEDEYQQMPIRPFLDHITITVTPNE